MTYDKRRERMLAEGRERLGALVRARMEAGERPEIQRHERWPVSLRRVSSAYRFFGIAAAIIIAFIGVQYVSGTFTNQQKTYTTAPTQRAKITLADGSVMLLAPSTSAQVTGRTIHLIGEALFTVTHDGDEPFTVKTGSTITRVLGTSFTVRRLAGDSITRVIVAQGKVALADAVLSSGNVGTVADGGRAQVTQVANIGNELAWTTGRLVFERTTLKEMIPDIRRWYGLNLSAPESLLNIPISTWLPLDNPRGAMSILATLLVADVNIDGQEATFTQTP